MNLPIRKGLIKKPQKIVIYGPAGIGKTTFASEFPDPIFIDTEGSTTHLDVVRLERPSSLETIYQYIKAILDSPLSYKTLVIDTIDWAEKLVKQAVIKRDGKSSIEDYGYGAGYTKLREEFGKLMNMLSDVVEKGMNVVIVAHSQIKKYEQPDTMGIYDKYELKLDKENSKTVMEWADMVLFANFKSDVIHLDDKGQKTRGTNLKRQLHTKAQASFDAKNRHNLDSPLEFHYDSIRESMEYFTGNGQTEPIRVNAKEAQEIQEEPKEQQTIKETPEVIQEGMFEATKEELASDVIPELKQLMQVSNVSVLDVERAVGPTQDGGLGYQPKGATIKNYPDGFQEFIVSAWSTEFLPQIEKNGRIPFEI